MLLHSANKPLSERTLEVKKSLVREDAVTQSDELRRQKDALKKKLREDHLPVIKQTGIIVPGISRRRSIVDGAMQWYFNGFLLAYRDGLLLVDPGVDFYTRFSTTGYTVKDIRGIFVSHEHIDHCGDLLVFIDSVAKTHTKIDMFIPINVVNNILPPHYVSLVNTCENINLIVMRESDTTRSQPLWPQLASLEIVPLRHSVSNTFGFKVRLNHTLVAYVSDTGYALTVKTSAGTFSPEETLSA